MRIVAITALHESFINPMVERSIELLFRFKVAAVAKLRLVFLHQKLVFSRIVRIVAVRTAYIVLKMRRSSKVAVFLAVLMTGEAPGANLFR